MVWREKENGVAAASAHLEADEASGIGGQTVKEAVFVAVNAVDLHDLAALGGC